MALPIDLGKVKKVATNIQKDIDYAIKINFYIDNSCNVKLISSIKEFLSQEESKIIINYIDVNNINSNSSIDCDLSFILGGDNENCVWIYKSLNDAQIPSLIICIDPTDFIDQANALAISIDKNDLICPDFSTYSWTVKDNENAIDFSEYNSVMDNSIKYKITNWLYYYSGFMRTVYAINFPILRPKIANDIIKECSLENAGIGIVKLIPGADMPLMTLNQVRMLLQLAAIYGYDINEDRVIEIIAIVASAFGFKYISNKVKKVFKIPAVIINSTISFSATLVLGNLAREYFASGYAIDGLVAKCKSFFKK